MGVRWHRELINNNEHISNCTNIYKTEEMTSDQNGLG